MEFLFFVDLRGFEPLTPCMPCRCATSCATGPSVVKMTTCLDYYRFAAVAASNLTIGLSFQRRSSE